MRFEEDKPCPGPCLSNQEGPGHQGTSNRTQPAAPHHLSLVQADAPLPSSQESMCQHKISSAPSPRLPPSPSVPRPGTLATHTAAETHVRKKVRRTAVSQQLLTICASSRHTRHQRRRVSGVGMTCGTEGPRIQRCLERHCIRAERASSAGLTADAAHVDLACVLSSHDGNRHTPPNTSILYTACTSYFLFVSSQSANQHYLILLAPPQVVARALPVRGMVDVTPQHIVRCKHDVSCG